MLQPPSLPGPALRRGGRGSIKLASDIGRDGNIDDSNEKRTRSSDSDS